MKATTLIAMLAIPSVSLAQYEADDATVVSEAGEAGLPETRVHETIHEILADEEFRRLHRNAKDEASAPEFPDWIKRLLDWLFPDIDTPTGTASSNGRADFSWLRGVMWLLVAVVIGFFVAILAKYLVTHLRDKQQLQKTPATSNEDAISFSRAPGELAADEYERRAMQAAESGDFKLAIGALQLGAMSWIERAGLIRFREGLTNRDYLRAIWRKTDQRTAFSKMVRIFELVFFGRREATEARYNNCLTNYREAFAREAPTTHPQT